MIELRQSDPVRTSRRSILTRLRWDRWGAWLGTVFAFWLATPASILAHDDILEQIAAIDAQMAASGVTGERLLKRAKLNLVHEDWTAALKDYKRAWAEDPQLNAAELGMAEAQLGAGNHESGLLRVESFLKKEPGDPAGILVRARLRAGAGELSLASADYRVAAEGLENRAGAIYYEWASCLRSGGQEYWSDALIAVDLGIALLGTNVPLQELGVEIELEMGDQPGAIERIDKLLAGPLRSSPRLIVLRAETQAAAGMSDEAQIGFRQVLEQIRSLPSRRQKTAAMRKLADRAEQGLSQIQSGSERGGSNPDNQP